MKEVAVMLPQLRVRTEFSFRETFAPISNVVARLKAINAPGAGIVDGGTWGHVRFAKAMDAAGLKPYFGTEIKVLKPDCREPMAWFLAEDTKAFYQFSSKARQPYANVEQLAATTKGVIRFAGSALTDPETFDYIDLNPQSVIEQLAAVKLAKHTGKPLVITCANSYCAPEDYNAFMGICGRQRLTAQYIPSQEEMLRLFRVDDQTLQRAIMNTHEAAERCATKLPKAPIIEVCGDLEAMAFAGRDRRLRLGHLKAWTVEYEERLARELAMVQQKKYESYFIVVSELITWAKQRMLVGPGRGSSAGSLLCYCLGITEVDPITNGLLFERFIDVTRNDLPDIDIDFSDTKREQVFDYLNLQYGVSNVARIGNLNTLKPKSALAEVCKRMDVPDSSKHALADAIGDTFVGSGDSLYGHVLAETLEHSVPGQAFKTAYPVVADVLTKVENHTWHTGVHAAGVIVCNVPVTDYCTVSAEGIAQIDKPDAEYLNLLKIDALGLRTLGIIEDAGVVDAETLYGLRLDDPEVFRVLNEGKFSGVFQFEGPTQRKITKEVSIDSLGTMDHLTALARPGPLGAGADQHYIERKNGREEFKVAHPALEPILQDTYGLVLYQEQVMQMVRDIGGFSWEDTSFVRKAISARKGAEFFGQVYNKFIDGAAKLGISAIAAKLLFDDLRSFGVYGMNKSHTRSYAVISYWCAWMKRYHQLEFAAACLRSAKDEEQTFAILRELDAEGIDYIPFDLERSQVNWSVSSDRKLVGGFRNLVGFGPVKAATAVENRNAGKLSEKQLHTIRTAVNRYAQLRPLQSKYRDVIENPEIAGCRPGSAFQFIGELPEHGSVLLLGKVAAKKHGDYNEPFRVAKRGRRAKGQSLFVDLSIVDDTGGPITCRIDRDEYKKFGMQTFEGIKKDDVVMIRGQVVPGFNMIKINNVRYMTDFHGIQQ